MRCVGESSYGHLGRSPRIAQQRRLVRRYHLRLALNLAPYARAAQGHVSPMFGNVWAMYGNVWPMLAHVQQGLARECRKGEHQT